MKIKDRDMYRQESAEKVLSILQQLVRLYGPDDMHAAIDELAKDPEVTRTYGTSFQRRVLLPGLRLVNRLLSGLDRRKK